MLPSDCNLSTHEYVHHFITDPNTIRHFDWCLNTIRELEVREEDLENDLDDLKSEYCELQENYNELKYQYDTILNSLIDVVDKFKD